MFSVWMWASRLLLLLALAVLCAVTVTVWPTGRDLDPIDLAAVAMLLVSTGGVALWTASVWIGDPRYPYRRPGLKPRDRSKGSHGLR
jgi:hypothetical protein